MICELRISELGEIITGNTPPTSDRSLYNGSYPLIMPTDIVEGQKYIGATEETVSDKGFEKYKRSLIPKDTPCVVTIGSIGKKICLSKEDSLTNQAINAVKVYQDKFDPIFVFYLLKYNLPQVKNLSSGTASGRENVSKSSFGKIKVKLPKDLTTQKKIASILSAYDDLIENNNQRIKLLEEMAEEIYKEWFVRMRFPGYQNAKFLDKDGTEVPHGTEGALPEGWRDGKVGDLIEIKKGKNITQSTITEGSVPVVAGGLTPAYYHNTANTISPTITVSASGANSGYVNLYYEDVWVSDCSYIDSGMTNLLYFFYSTLRVRQKEVFHLQKGSAQPHVYSKDIMSLKLSYPEGILLNQFEDLIKPFYDEIGVLKNKNKVLRETRDLLLPRLISGKLSVEKLKYNEPENLSMAAEPVAHYNG